MGSKKASAQFYTPPDTKDTNAARDYQAPDDPVLDQTKAYASELMKPSDISKIGPLGYITNPYETARRDMDESYSSPYSGINNPVLRQRMRDVSEAKLSESEGSALQTGLAQERATYVPLSIEAQHQRDQDEINRRLGLARITAPQLAQAPQSNGLLGSLVGAGAQIGTLAIVA